MRFQATKFVLLAVLGFGPTAAFGHPRKPVSTTVRPRASSTALRSSARSSASSRKIQADTHTRAAQANLPYGKHRLSAEAVPRTGKHRAVSLTLASAHRARIPAVKPVWLGDSARRVAPRPQVEPVNLPAPEATFSARGGSFGMLPALKGSHENLIRQNVMADQDGLTRVQDDADLERMRLSGQLVPIPAAAGIQIDSRLPLNRRFCRPWTAQFLSAVAAAHYAYFHTPLQVNSAVRTVEFQHRLQRINGNAAPADGETASPHLTGQAVDLAKKGLSLAEIAWMRAYLTPLIQEGKLDVEEEFQQACFHISVYRRFAPSALPRSVVQDRSFGGAAIATGATMR